MYMTKMHRCLWIVLKLNICRGMSDILQRNGTVSLYVGHYLVHSVMVVDSKG